MVRAPAKTCPNLSRLFEDGEPDQLRTFLTARTFEKLTWLGQYWPNDGSSNKVSEIQEMLRQEKKERLHPLETEATRIVTIAGSRGQFALEGLARTKLLPDEMQTLTGQRDDLARSFWAYLNKAPLFEAVENSLHLRLYRRYDKHYQTFIVDPLQDVASPVQDAVLDKLLEELRHELDRGDGYDIERFDIPADGDEPAAVMYLLFHPDPPSSVREIDEMGNRSRIYFRPPGEAMVVHTPSTGRIHVRARTRHLRHVIAQQFIKTVLEQEPSSQPVDFQAYDISRFLSDVELPTPELDDVIILQSRLIRADISVDSLATRLSVSTTIDHDIGAIIESQPGLRKTFERAIAIRFIEIAVRYRRAGRDIDEVLNFTISDRNTSSLLSLEDPFERVLGHRLLRSWGMLRDGRAPSEADSMSVLPALLALWDVGSDRVSGGWLRSRSIDTQLLIDIGFLVPMGWEGDDLIDDEDEIGQVAAQVIPRPEGPDVQSTEGQVAPGTTPDAYRVYRVRDGWVAQHLRETLLGALDTVAVEVHSPHLLSLGSLRINDRDAPVYLARGLDDEAKRVAVDTELRSRADLGIGLVLQAGTAKGSCLASNVLTSVADHIDESAAEIVLSADSMQAVFRRNRALARGGETVRLERSGENFGTLSVPGRGTIDIEGANRLLVIERLVNAYINGPKPMKSGDLTKGIEGQSLANIFGKALWTNLRSGFVRSPKNTLWEIAI